MGLITHELLINLFKGYAINLDMIFKDYSQKKKDARSKWEDTISNSLVIGMLNKYQYLVEDDRFKDPSAKES